MGEVRRAALARRLVATEVAAVAASLADEAAARRSSLGRRERAVVVGEVGGGRGVRWRLVGEGVREGWLTLLRFGGGVGFSLGVCVAGDAFCCFLFLLIDLLVCGAACWV